MILSTITRLVFLISTTDDNDPSGIEGHEQQPKDGKPRIVDTYQYSHHKAEHQQLQHHADDGNTKRLKSLALQQIESTCGNQQQEQSKNGV